MTGRTCHRCGSELEPSRTHESYTGAVLDHLTCPTCFAGGTIVANPPGRKAVLEIGTALNGRAGP